MANIDLDLSISGVDSIGVAASAHFYGQAPDTSTLADLVTGFENFLTDYGDLSALALKSASVSISVDPTAFSHTAADSNAEAGLLLNLSQTSLKYKYGIWVPAVHRSIISGGHINLSDSALVATMSLLTGGSSPITFLSEARKTLVALVDASEAFRKLRRKAEKITKSY